jgi:HSP20 family protein
MSERSTTVLRFRDPFEDMDRLLDSFGGRWRGGIMPMDAYLEDEIYVLRFDLPGVDPDGVDVTVESGVLTVTAERPIEETTEDATWLLRERPTGTHRREVRLGDRLDTAGVEATYDNGVLTVTIPMREEAKPRRVEVGSMAREKLTADVS